MVFASNDNQMTFIYNGKDEVHKRTLAYFTGLKKPLLDIDISKQLLTGTQWTSILELGTNKISKAIRTDHKLYKQLKGDQEAVNTNDLLKALKHSPSLLLHPVMIYDNDIKIIEQPYKFADFMEADGNNLSRNHAEDIKQD